MTQSKEALLELYEARGDPDTFDEAKRLYEEALAGPEASDPKAWRSIIDWCETRDAPLTAEWPMRELARVRRALERRSQQA